ncbi:MAG: 23S rRNA (uracil(1939)-C(5))-methyltransferase RlmD, partial [Clostridia bacterium]|nr:23S rRNA (uracil(1939)-C(5))-methyltransferase RlmD [Clostridia bacterium]
MAPAKNDIIEIEITGTTHDGSGVGRLGGLVIFIPACAQGDTVRAQLIHMKKNLAYARLIEVLKPSPSRIGLDCPVFYRCGGCAFRHIAYDKELEIKQQRVADALQKIGGLEIVPEKILACEETLGYRNKAQYPVALSNGEIQIGFYARASHRIVGDDACLLQPRCFEQALGAFRQWIGQSGVSIYNEADGTGLLRHIYLRLAQATGELMACAVVNGDSIPQSEPLVRLLKSRCPQLKSVVLNVNTRSTNAILGPRCELLWGAERITDILCGLKIELSPLSFYQVNRPQAERLYGLAAEFADLNGNLPHSNLPHSTLPHGGLLLDLYCGAGTIGLSMAGQAAKVIGVEAVADAVEDARRNARINGIKNAEFLCADATDAACRLLAQGLRPDVVVIDPPRSGCSAQTISAITQMSPARVVYVSCDPATLARDLALFGQSGYRCARVKPVDMFPRTAHVETVVLMT